MTAAAARPFPGPRTYHSWLRELAPLQPQRFWFCHLLVHRVEALVAVAQSHRLEAFPLALLRRLFVAPTSAANLASLERLHVDRQLAIPLLRELAAADLLHADRDAWTLTATGQQALQQVAYIRHTREHRVFYFVENPSGLPQYLPLMQTAGPVADLSENWSFDPGPSRRMYQAAARLEAASRFSHGRRRRDRRTGSRLAAGGPRSRRTRAVASRRDGGQWRRGTADRFSGSLRQLDLAARPASAGAAVGLA